MGAGILVIKLGAFGDFFLALGAFDAIRRHHRGERLILLTIPALADFARATPYFDEIWVDERRRTLSHYLEVRARLRGARLARVYDLQCQKRTERYFLSLFPGPWPEWVGSAPGASHRDRSLRTTPRHPLERYRRLLALAGIEEPDRPNLDWLEPVALPFECPRHPVLLVPGSSPARPSKRWPVRSFAALARRIVAEGFTPLVLGTEQERDLAGLIRAECPEAVDLTGQTDMAAIAGLARRARFAVGNDTGPMHAISLCGCPTLVLFSGESCPARSSPVGPSVLTLQDEPIDRISPDRVMATLAEFRATAPTGPSSLAKG